MSSRDANHEAVGILCALPGELGIWAERGELLSSEAGLGLRRVSAEGQEVLTCVGGVGKVAAARAAEALMRAGARRALLIVGTCGALERSISPGALVHCREAVQADLGVRAGRVSTPDAAWSEAWREAAQGVEAVFLTSDRAIFSPWRRWMARRACAGPCVADMETAAAAACATAWGVPWVALRAVTDRAGWGGGRSFKKRYPVEAGRAADSVAGLLARMRA